MASPSGFRTLLREDLHSFIEWAFYVLNAGTKFQDNWHIRAIVHHLMKVSSGVDSRLLMNMPPRSLKSHCASVCWPAWEMGRNPAYKFIIASYGAALAEFLALQTRTIMEHSDYRAAFPHTVFADNSPLDLLKTTAGGYRYLTSVGGAVTGVGCDFVIADDLSKASASSAEREKSFSFYKSSLLTRLNDKKTGRAVVVGQRIALDDLPGYLIDQGGYTQLILPAYALAANQIEIGPNKFKHFRKGEYLHETREGKETLERARREFGDENFAAQYLQDPKAAQGAILDTQWFPSFETQISLHRYDFRVLSVDTAHSTGDAAHYSAASVFGGDGNSYDLLHVWRARMKCEDLIARILLLIDQFHITHVIVERTSAGFALLDALRKKYAYGVFDFHSQLGKEDRVNRVIPFFRSGRIRLPANAPWLPSFKKEFFSFPNVPYDDQVDTIVQFAFAADSLLGAAPLLLRDGEEQVVNVYGVGGY